MRRPAPLGPLAARRVLAATWAASVALAPPPYLGLGGRLRPPLPASLTRCMWVPALNLANMTYLFVRCSTNLLLCAVMVDSLAALPWGRSDMTKGGRGSVCVEGCYTGVTRFKGGGLWAGRVTLGEDIRHISNTIRALGVLCLLALLGRIMMLMPGLAQCLGDDAGWTWFPCRRRGHISQPPPVPSCTPSE